MENSCDTTIGGNTGHFSVESEDLKLITPFTGIISGPSGCGKTWMISKILSNIHNITNPPINKTIYLYSIWQDIYTELEKKV